MPQLWSPNPLSPGYLSVDRLLQARAQHMKLTSLAPRVGATAYRQSTVDQGRRKTFTEHISNSWIAGCREREWRRTCCALLGVLGLGPCRAGRHAGTVMVSNGHSEHGQLCVRHSASKQSKARGGSPSHSLLAVLCAA
jgi:hypothetical protein